MRVGFHWSLSKLTTGHRLLLVYSLGNDRKRDGGSIKHMDKDLPTILVPGAYLDATRVKEVQRTIAQVIRPQPRDHHSSSQANSDENKEPVPTSKSGSGTSPRSPSRFP